jgi:hypothetical protein
MVFILVVIAPLLLISELFDRGVKKQYVDVPSYIISTRLGDFDYAVGGSSRTRDNFNTLLFDSISRKKGFNIGYDGAALAENYLTLHLFLKSGNTAKNFLLQIDDFCMADPSMTQTYPFHEYLFIQYMNDDVVKDCFRKNTSIMKYYFWKCLPFTKYAEFNNYYGVYGLFKDSSGNPEFLKYKGYRELIGKHEKGFVNRKYRDITNAWAIHPDNLYFLDKIIALCKKNNINLIFYSSPFHDRYYKSYKSDNLHKALLKYVSENKIPYYDFMTDKYYAGDSLFIDKAHLNSEGTNLFTKQLADSLKKVLI